MSQKKADGQDPAIEEIARIAHEISGVQLSLRHRSMIESRLYRRIKELELSDLSSYVEYLQSNLESETKLLISLLTTHHTFFFREMAHFEFLRDQGLKQVVENIRKEGRNELRIWSAACSRGQEAYSLAMWILPWLEKNAPGIKLKILGTDVDEESVKFAANGVYARSELAEVPLALLDDHWAKGTGEIASFVKAKNSLKTCMEFRVENLFRLSHIKTTFDIIFCRNVFIYFSQDQIKGIVKSFLPRLSASGFLILGISETLNGMELPVGTAGPSIYRHKSAVTAVAAPLPLQAVVKPLRVLCVDDSPTILAVMKKVLDQKGFELAGTCQNGEELHERLRRGEVDVVTLDIHMPVLDGLEYLRKYWKEGHPPVVMVSSVSREDSDLALSALKLGAVDYVEKPSLSNLAERGEEIRNKLKMAAMGSAKPKSTTFDSQFKPAQAAPVAAGRRILLFSSGDSSKAASFLRSYLGKGALLLAVDLPPGANLSDLQAKICQESGKSVNLIPGVGAQLVSAGDVLTKLAGDSGGNVTSVMILGRPSDVWIRSLAPLRGVQILLEDGFGAVPDRLLGKEVHTIPMTSFTYQSEDFFGRKARKAA